MDFLEDPNKRVVCVSLDAQSKVAIQTDLMLLGAQVGGAYFIKRSHPVLNENIDTFFIQGLLSQEALKQLNVLCRDVFLPIMHGSHSLRGQKELLASVQRFIATLSITIGHTEGQTVLPLPAIDENIKLEQTASHDVELDPDQKELIHSLEGTIVLWTKQIKVCKHLRGELTKQNVLKLDPETSMKQGLNPRPIKEVQFWEGKAVNLDSIQAQLSSDFVKKIMRVLEMAKSTYAQPFSRLCKEVALARVEAIEIMRFLDALLPHIRVLEEVAFEGVVVHFRSLLVASFFVWKHSKYYNTPSRMVLLIRQFANELIHLVYSPFSLV